MPFGIDTRWLYLGLLGVIVLERLVELVLTERNKRRLLARGGKVVGESHYRYMVMLHASFLAAAPLEVWWLERPWIAPLAMTSLVVVGSTMALRYWAIATLGDRWTTQIVVVPGEPPVTHGPYRFLRHPNYLAVVLEIAALPLVHSAWLTAVLYSLLNAVVLRIRILEEEDALASSAPYREHLGNHPRLVPGLRRRP